MVAGRLGRLVRSAGKKHVGAAGTLLLVPISPYKRSKSPF